jgi:hypothetical protein
MAEPTVENLVGGVVTRAAIDSDGGLVVSISNDNGHFVVEAKACRCGEPCDLTHIGITKISGSYGK